MQRNVSVKTKRKIVAQQKHACNNRPGSQIRNLEGFDCPLWKKIDDPGMFDAEWYQIDHIMEFAISHDDSENNLQALCVTCHREKTRRFNEARRKNKQIIKKQVISDKSDDSDEYDDYVDSQSNESDVQELQNNYDDESDDIENEPIKLRFQCDKCSKFFARQCNYLYHINNQICERTEFGCEYCDQTFTTATSKYRHQRLYCKEKEQESENVSDDNIPDKEEILNAGYEELKALYDVMKRIDITKDDILEILSKKKNNLKEKSSKSTIQNKDNNYDENNGISNMNPLEKKDIDIRKKTESNTSKRIVAPRNGRKRKTITKSNKNKSK